MKDIKVFLKKEKKRHCGNERQKMKSKSWSIEKDIIKWQKCLIIIIRNYFHLEFFPFEREKSVFQVSIRNFFSFFRKSVHSNVSRKGWFLFKDLFEKFAMQTKSPVIPKYFFYFALGQHLPQNIRIFFTVIFFNFTHGTGKRAMLLQFPLLFSVRRSAFYIYQNNPWNFQPEYF